LTQFLVALALRERLNDFALARRDQIMRHNVGESARRM
jgi:hypothetical protein